MAPGLKHCLAFPTTMVQILGGGSKPDDEAPVDGSRTTLRICNFLEHQGTAKHIGNVNQLLGLKLKTPDSV